MFIKPLRKLNAKSQSMVEYAAIIIMILAVFILMSAYYKRALQGKMSQATDALSGGALIP